MSPQSANFIFMAIGRMLQWNSSSAKVIKLLNEVAKWDDCNFLRVLVIAYLKGYGIYLTTAKMSLDDGIFLWRNLRLCLGRINS
ncbi:MAG: hypothetical protein LBI69_01735 [Puniceicoccales bacterium]|jgi:hypothetical protein|nr:hypothetical protein [Puniceicoccales bacterium]